MQERMDKARSRQQDSRSVASRIVPNFYIRRNELFWPLAETEKQAAG
jgi:hypothetical protein